MTEDNSNVRELALGALNAMLLQSDEEVDTWQAVNGSLALDSELLGTTEEISGCVATVMNGEYPEKASAMFEFGTARIGAGVTIGLTAAVRLLRASHDWIRVEMGEEAAERWAHDLRRDL